MDRGAQGEQQGRVSSKAEAGRASVSGCSCSGGKARPLGSHQPPHPALNEGSIPTPRLCQHGPGDACRTTTDARSCR